MGQEFILYHCISHITLQCMATFPWRTYTPGYLSLEAYTLVYNPIEAHTLDYHHQEAHKPFPGGTYTWLCHLEAHALGLTIPCRYQHQVTINPLSVTYHFLQFFFRFIDSFPVITIHNKYKTLERIITEVKYEMWPLNFSFSEHANCFKCYFGIESHSKKNLVLSLPYRKLMYDKKRGI